MCGVCARKAPNKKMLSKHDRGEDTSKIHWHRAALRLSPDIQPFKINDVYPVLAASLVRLDLKLFLGDP